MVLSLNFSLNEAKKIAAGLKEYPSLPTPSKYELARHQVGDGVITIYTSGKVVVQAPALQIEDALKERIIALLDKDSNELIFGLDEVGRGERHGAFVIAGVLGNRNALRGIRDSKKTNDMSKKFKEASQHSLLQASVSFNAEYVDALRKKGKNLNEMELVVAKHLYALVKELESDFLTIMDGKAMKNAPKGIVFLEKGDDIEPSVGAASVVAKFLRNESGDKAERKTWKKQTPN